MSTQIRLRRGIAAQWTSVNPVLALGEAGYETDTRKLKIGDGTTAWSGLPYFIGNLPGGALNDLGDVTITDAANGDFLRWNGTAWVNDAVNLGTDTIGNYVVDVAGGTGVTVSHTLGEASTASISIGQAVGTSSSVTFAAVTAPLIGNADTASQLATSRVIALSGDVTGSVSFNGSSSVDIATTIQPNSVALGTDTTGNFMTDVAAGTGVTITHTPGEGSTASIAIGQSVATSASVQFANIDTTGDITVGGNLTVNGTTTTLNTETLAVEDNIIVLNSNVTGSPSTNAGIEVERGDSSNVVLRWNESTDSWEVTEDGSVYKNIAVGQDVETSSSVIFAAVTASTFTGNLVGNADTASRLATARTIALGGDLSGSVSFSGSTDVTLTATVVNSGISLDEISDVIITSQEEFQGLSYNGTNWVNSHIPLVSYVQNAEATTITTGTCVYLFGGTGDHASVKRADNSSDTTSSKTVGVAGVNIAAGQNGPIITRGYVDGIDLSVGYTAGDVLWLGDNGAFTTTKPSAPEHLVFIGVVVRATNNGIIYVATQNGYELEELHDVKITSPQNNDFLKYNSASAIWVNDPINLGTDTTGDYVASLVAGTGVTLSNNSGESASPTIAIGQAVATTSSVTFAAVTAPLIGNADTASQLATARTISLSGDVTGSASFNGSANADIVATIAANSVALGTDTTGDYVASLVAGTGVSLANNSGENATPTISIGQAVATSSSVTFAQVTASVVSISVAPSSATDAATKGYVDQVTAGINWHESVAYATATALPNSPDYAAGSADQSSGTGIGATLTATTYGRLQVDGANTSTNQRVLVKNQANAIHNGVYDVTEQGSASVYWILTRADDSDNSVAEQVKTGDAVYVVNGTVNAAQGFLINSTGSLSGNTIQIGTDNITWTQFTGTATFTAGTGLSTSGNTINVNTANSGRIVVNADNIDLAEVTPTYQAGSASNQFITSVIPDAYGRFTGAIISPIREASTTQTGIARFNSEQFTVSSGSVSIKSGGITSTEIANGTIVNSNVSETAGIALMKLQYGTSGQIIVAASDGTPAWQAITGDISVNASGVATIAANSVALGTDTTGNYLVNVVAQPGLAITHTPGEGSTASIGLDSVIASSNSGASGTNFISAITVDGYGRVTSYTASDVQDASTSSKGIARFDSNHFSVSSGSVSLSTTACPTFAGINITGTASVSGTLTAASTTVRVKYDTNKSIIALNADASNSSADVFQLISNYNIGTTDHTGHLLMKDSTNTSTRSGMVFRQSSSVAGIDVGPRLLVTSSGANDPLMSLDETAAASAVFYVNRHTSGSVGVVLKEFGSSSTNMLEIRDSTNASYLSIGGSSSSFQLNATSASLNSASISTASISTVSVSGNLTVGGDLTVNGTTTTVNSTTITVDDPIITLGGDAAPGSDDNKDRGIEFRYHSGTAASVGFMGYDDSTGRFIFLTGATNTSEVFSGTNASVEVGSLFISSAGGGVTLHGLLSTPTLKAEYSASIYATLEASMSGPAIRLNNNQGEGVIAIEGGGTRFTFSRPILSASLASASVDAPVLSGSVHYDSSASVTLPAKTFFPEEYLTVSSSVTLNATTHRYATLEMTASAGTSVITVPADASSDFPVGSVIQIIRVGAGEVQVTASAGVTVNNALGSRLRAQWSTATLRKRAANTWLLSGDLKV